MKIMDRQTQYYEIVGDNLEMLKLSIDPKFKVFAEAGKMIYTRGGVTMESRLPEKEGTGFFGKVMGAGKRALAGESLFFTYYEGTGQAGFAGDFPGRILPIGLSNQTMLAQKDAFIAAIGEIEISIAMQKKIGGALFGGEGIFLTTLTGPGIVIIQTMTLAKLRRQIGLSSGESESSGIGTVAKTIGGAGAAVGGGILGSLFGGEDD